VRTDEVDDDAAAERLAVGEVVERDERHRVSYISTDVTVCTSTAYLCLTCAKNVLVPFI
jgi:hypothetical protein